MNPISRAVDKLIDVDQQLTAQLKPAPPDWTVPTLMLIAIQLGRIADALEERS